MSSVHACKKAVYKQEFGCRAKFRYVPRNLQQVQGCHFLNTREFFPNLQEHI